jgi:molecular chaperone DnaK (HSP70)
MYKDLAPMPQKDFYIPSEATRLIDYDGATNFPTVLLYTANGVRVGLDALRDAAGNRALLNEDFKLDLGLSSTRPTPGGRKHFAAADGTPRSSDDLAGDFIRYIISFAKNRLREKDLQAAEGIYVAEPLAMNSDVVGEEWLKFYRSKIKVILIGQGFPKNNIHFLPEPFAVYQYYRYENKHPLLYSSATNRVLVVDFGGGTLDVCIIETKQTGDVKEGGKNSRPLAASSAPVGGFFINRKICEHILRRIIPRHLSSRMDKAIKAYDRWRRDGHLQGVEPDAIAFASNLHNLIHTVEGSKIALCQRISDWSLTGAIADSVSVKVPKHPFDKSEEFVDVPFSGAEFRELFLKHIWPENLRPTIQDTLRRGKKQLEGGSINLVLLSGGSANIEWLKTVIAQDLGGDLPGAQVLSVGNYQEVVAKGLAIQCAKRFHSEDEPAVPTGAQEATEFTATTYNPLSLIVQADDHPPVLPRYASKQVTANIQASGLLLPSGTYLAKVIDQPLTWKFRLESPPRNRLHYYFTRSVIDPKIFEEEMKEAASVLDSKRLVSDVYNFQQQHVATPKDSFNKSLKVELRIDESNLARCKFIYREATESSPRVEVEGRPFTVDMVTSLPPPPPPQPRQDRVFLGIDFGTSNSSVSFVSRARIGAFEISEAEEAAGGLPGLCHTLPYPLAEPLSRYLAAANRQEQHDTAVEFIEAGLMMTTYLTYLDSCAVAGQGHGKRFKNFRQRSAGDLWTATKALLQQDGLQFAKPFTRLIGLQHAATLEAAVAFINQAKHNKAPKDHARLVPTIRLLAGELRNAFEHRLFGYFSNVQKLPHSDLNAGVFHNAVGNPPFYHRFNYSGPHLFSSEQAFLIDTQEKLGLPLYPLLFWNPCEKHVEAECANGHCFVFDKLDHKQKTYTYKAVRYQCEVTAVGELEPLARRLDEMYREDPAIELVPILSLKKVPEITTVAPGHHSPSSA